MHILILDKEVCCNKDFIPFGHSIILHFGNPSVVFLVASFMLLLYERKFWMYILISFTLLTSSSNNNSIIIIIIIKIIIMILCNKKQFFISILAMFC